MQEVCWRGMRDDASRLWQVVENEAAKLAARAMEDDAALDKHGSSLGLVRVGSKERWAKILSREEKEEIESEREREREKNWERYIEPEVNKQMIKKNLQCTTMQFHLWNYTIAYCKKFWDLEHLMKHEYWCLVCQMPNIWHLTHLIEMLILLP